MEEFGKRIFPRIKVSYFVRRIFDTAFGRLCDDYEAVLSFPCAGQRVARGNDRRELEKVSCNTKFKWVRQAMLRIGCFTCQKKECRIWRELNEG